MINLDTFQRTEVEAHYRLINENIVDQLYRRINNSKLKNTVKHFLKRQKIEDILFSQPENLYSIYVDFIKAIDSKMSMEDYENYLNVRQANNKDKETRKLCSLFDSTLKKISKIFDYNHYISSKKKASYALAEIIGKNSCVYCNRQYTITVVNPSIKTRKVNDTTRVTRPQFDHWFPKSKFPLLALSFYNLIPSCGVCNSSVKSSEIFRLDTHIHPYIDKNSGFNFDFIYDRNGQPEIIIRHENDKARRTVNDLKLEEIYNWHSQYELKDLIDLVNAYPQVYIDSLSDLSIGSEFSREEIFRLIFGTEINAKDFHKRPMSKFKHDILKELGVID